MAKEKLIAIHWLPKSYLADTELMDRATEHAYFRLLQYIYLTQDRLPDDDTKVARLLKCKSVAEWRKIKAELLQPRGLDPETGEEIPARIYIQDNKILSKKCTQKLAEASKARKQHSAAGKASANKRSKSPKSHIYKESGSTVVVTTDGTVADTTDTTADATTVITAEGTNLNSLSYRKTSPLPPAGSGSAGAPPARPSDRAQVSQDDRVEVDVGGGVIFAIAANGLCDHVFAPRDSEIPELLPAAALELRAKAIAEKSLPPAPKPAAEARPINLATGLPDDQEDIPDFMDRRMTPCKPVEAA